MNILQFVAKLNLVAIEARLAEKRGLEAGAKIIEHEAKAEIGHYQPATNQLEAWPALSGATMDGFRHPQAGWIPGKTELGYPEAPLEREGHLERSISSGMENDHTAAVGSDDEVAVYQELGTPDALYPIPPRSFLARAAIIKGQAAVEQIGARVVWALRGFPKSES